MKSNNKKAFTLVELIVVIVILTVLATIAFITLGNYPAKSRDAKRTNDINLIAKKIAILETEGIDLFEFVEGNTAASPTPTLTDYTINSKEGKVDFAKLRETEEKFKDPAPKEASKKDYTIVVIKGVGVTGTSNAGKKFECYEIGAIGEIQEKIFFSSCKVHGFPDNQIFAGTKKVSYK